MITDSKILLNSKIMVVLPNGKTYPESGICVIQAVSGKRYKLCSTELGWYLEEWGPTVTEVKRKK